MSQGDINDYLFILSLYLSSSNTSESFNELDAEAKANLEEERLVKAASRSVIKKVVATPTIERGPVGIYLLFIVVLKEFP
jgi:hypothetical protein